MDERKMHRANYRLYSAIFKARKLALKHDGVAYEEFKKFIQLEDAAWFRLTDGQKKKALETLGV